jgi:hypothetical protein
MLKPFAFHCGLSLLLISGACAQSENQAPSPHGASERWVQGYAHDNKDCMVWSDSCVTCLRSKTDGDYSCSNIGIACQPKEVTCIRRVGEPDGH